MTEAGLGQVSEERETLKSDQKMAKEFHLSSITQNSFPLFSQQMCHSSQQS